MILVDSSALVEYYRPKGIPEVQAAVTEAIEADAAAVNGIIQVEVLAFVSGRASFDELLDDFKVFHRIALQETDFDRATEMGFSLRSRGVSVPPTDLIIAASAIRAGAILYHTDGHYDMLSRYYGLKAKNLLT
ncbi:MAG: PIN domain-containing protein [Thermoanaerobaculia bacterium]